MSCHQTPRDRLIWGSNLKIGIVPTGDGEQTWQLVFSIRASAG